MDILSNILRLMRLQGSVYFRSCFSSPWGIQINQNRRASFHIVVHGQCMLQIEGIREPLLL
ncbi:hypothetical protein GCM10027342_39780 [Photobacterium alginatilyticum]|uniref:AraC family transcriptional regulator n=1 Tax=Photobacterium alginatilyticum TaxID=1775171 RepID=A0ABW9YLZ3_9GAMM|nr:AraC family transcriptional regulator [Photobacterium alginatilyticum]